MSARRNGDGLGARGGEGNVLRHQQDFRSAPCLESIADRLGIVLPVHYRAIDDSRKRDAVDGLVAKRAGSLGEGLGG